MLYTNEKSPKTLIYKEFPGFSIQSDGPDSNRRPLHVSYRTAPPPEVSARKASKIQAGRTVKKRVVVYFTIQGKNKNDKALNRSSHFKTFFLLKAVTVTACVLNKLLTNHNTFHIPHSNGSILLAFSWNLFN